MLRTMKPLTYVCDCRIFTGDPMVYSLEALNEAWPFAGFAPEVRTVLL